MYAILDKKSMQLKEHVWRSDLRANGGAVTVNSKKAIREFTYFSNAFFGLMYQGRIQTPGNQEENDKNKKHHHQIE